MIKKMILMIIFVSACLITAHLFFIRLLGIDNLIVHGFINGGVLVLSLFLGNILIFKYRINKKK
jgi:hypothetical protein